MNVGTLNSPPALLVSMRQAQVSSEITVNADEDLVIIEDGMNGEVSLQKQEMLAVITLFAQEGGLLNEDVGVNI